MYGTHVKSIFVLIALLVCVFVKLRSDVLDVVCCTPERLSCRHAPLLFGRNVTVVAVACPAEEAIT
eukprot:8335061-Pyramimonas_sp.AAC.1